jgi:glycosyltransferase involved in cell wall biosynthesis
MSRNRRLLIAAQPRSGGVTRHIVDLLAALDPDRYDVDVACPAGSILWDELGGRRGVRLHRIVGARRPSPADAASLARLLPLVRRADLVHGHSSKAGFLVRAAAAATGRRRRCVFTPHAWSFWAKDVGATPLYRALERTAAHWCERIMVGAEGERRAGLDAGVGKPEQYRVVPNGIDLARFAADPEPVPGRVVMVGRLSAQKRPDVAVRAAALVRPRVPGFELHFAGTGPQADETAALAATLGVGDAVKLLGNRADVAGLLTSAACFLVTSDYEGSPIAAIEAMAAGVPVVGSRVGGLPETIDDGRTGLLFESGDHEGAANALITVLTDGDRRRRLGEAARAEAHARYGRERMAAAVEAVYDELLVGH